MDAQRFSEIREEFSSLRYQRHSFPLQLIYDSEGGDHHPLFEELLNAGSDVVPMLLEDIRDAEPTDLSVPFWIWGAALGFITGASPVPETQAGRFEAVREAWTRWGEEQDLIEGG